MKESVESVRTALATFPAEIRLQLAIEVLEGLRNGEIRDAAWKSLVEDYNSLMEVDETHGH